MQTVANFAVDYNHLFGGPKPAGRHHGRLETHLVFADAKLSTAAPCRGAISNMGGVWMQVPNNPFVFQSGGTVALGVPSSWRFYAWDCDFGEQKINVAAFYAQTNVVR